MPDKESRGLKPEELAQDTGRKKVPKAKVARELLILLLAEPLPGS